MRQGPANPFFQRNKIIKILFLNDIRNGSHPLPHIPECTREFTESDRYSGIKVLSAVPKNDCARLVMRESRFITASGSYCVITVGNRQDAGAERNLLAGQTIRVAGSIPPLVVRTGGLDTHFNEIIIGIPFMDRPESLSSQC